MMYEHKIHFETGSSYRAKVLRTPLRNFQRDLNKMEEQAIRNLMKLNKNTCEHLPWEGITLCCDTGWGLPGWGAALREMSSGF